MSRSCAGVVVVRFCQVSERARIWMPWVSIMSGMATERFSWNKERILRVPSVRESEVGPGLTWMSPDRAMSKDMTGLDLTFRDEQLR